MRLRLDLCCGRPGFAQPLGQIVDRALLLDERVLYLTEASLEPRDRHEAPDGKDEGDDEEQEREREHASTYFGG